MFRGASLNAEVRHEAERRASSFRDSEECPRNRAAAVDDTAANNTASFSWKEEEDTVWHTHLKRYLMQGKFISPIAIRALCFTRCLVKPSSVLCSQAKSQTRRQRDAEQLQDRPSDFSSCEHKRKLADSFTFICQRFMV